MISLEMAKQLKEAGLGWEPKIADFHWQEDESEMRIVQYTPEKNKELAKKCIWRPRLDQLLEEIEKRGYCVDIVQFRSMYECLLWEFDKKILNWVPLEELAHENSADTRENATAKVLLWILRGGQGD